MTQISTRERLRHTPARYKDAEGSPVFIFKVPDLFEREDYTRQVARRGTVYHTRERLKDLRREGVRAVLVPDQHDYWLAKLDRWDEVEEDLMEARKSLVDAARRGDEDGMKAESSALVEQYGPLSEEIDELEIDLIKQYQPLAEAKADNNYYLRVSQIQAFLSFLVGWENIDGIPDGVRDPGRSLPLALIDAVDQDDLDDAGLFMWSKLHVNKDQAKNFETPPSSSSSPETTKAAKPRRTAARAGKSSAKGSKRTRNTKSRRKSGRSSTSGATAGAG
ncbi:MAG: hypothetical protein MI755_16295 [Sphingomonadales bacterium]|nr:hypothetical protein [Sphingomonadales bacterium]